MSEPVVSDTPNPAPDDVGTVLPTLRLLADVRKVATSGLIPEFARELHATVTAAKRLADVAERLAVVIQQLFAPAVQNPQSPSESGESDSTDLEALRRSAVLESFDLVVAVWSAVCITLATPKGESAPARMTDLAALQELHHRSPEAAADLVVRRLARDPACDRLLLLWSQVRGQLDADVIVYDWARRNPDGWHKFVDDVVNEALQLVAPDPQQQRRSGVDKEVGGRAR